MEDQEERERIAQVILTDLVYSIGERLDEDYDALTDAEYDRVYKLVRSRVDI